tara:strand:- start:13 stop:852 length:840 start_codon:yes stop_codon:yes gene_type:complete
MEKGIACLGCSYTWGEGLYFYSGLEGLPFKKNHGFNQSTMRPPFDLYRQKYRWPRLIANKLDSWEYTSDIGNGGSNIAHYSYCLQQPLIWGKIKYSDFDYLVWQFTDVMRDYPGGFHNTHSLQHEEFEIAYKIEKQRMLKFAESVIKEWEQNGVTVLVWNWFDDFIDEDEYNEFFKNRHVPIHFEGNDYFCLNYLIGECHDDIDLEKTKKGNLDDVTYKIDIGKMNTKTRKKLTIRDDFSEKELQKNDGHLNKLGNEIIADSIYRKIQQLKKQINQKLI